MAGTIAGTVVDVMNNQPIEGAAVSAQPGDHTATTNGEGKYSISLPGGSYGLTISKAGYQPFNAEDIFVMDNVTTEINVALTPSQ